MKGSEEVVEVLRPSTLKRAMLFSAMQGWQGFLPHAALGIGAGIELRGKGSTALQVASFELRSLGTSEPLYIPVVEQPVDTGCCNWCPSVGFGQLL